MVEGQSQRPFRRRRYKMKKCRVYNSARVWRLGMWIVITVTNIVNAFGCMPVSYFQGAANDCECRGNWELIPPQFTICPPADRNLPGCPDRRVEDRQDNPSCNLSLLIHPKVIRERILRYWGWVSDTECNNLNFKLAARFAGSVRFPSRAWLRTLHLG